MIKRLVLILVIFLFASISFAKDVSVHGYTRKDGTYVAPYTRSSPSPSTYKSNSGSYSSSSSPSIPIIPADSVKVDGYYRKDGTYVRPHDRSAPDDDLSNNYGSASFQQRQQYQSSTTLPSYNNDYDNDGVANRRDRDDDNDGVSDNYDSGQYSRQNNNYRSSYVQPSYNYLPQTFSPHSSSNNDEDDYDEDSDDYDE